MRSYGRSTKFFWLDGLLIFRIVMGLRSASSAIIMIYFFHNSCVVSFEFRNVVKITIGSYVSVHSSSYEASVKLESTKDT